MLGCTGEIADCVLKPQHCKQHVLIGRTTWVIAETLQVPMIEAEHSLFRAWSNCLTEDCRILLLKSILFNHWSAISKSYGLIVQLIGSARIETVVSEILLPLAIALSLFTAH